MQKVKFLAIALVLGFAGAVSAASNMQDAPHAHASAKAANCCAAHKKEGKRAAAQSCDKNGAGCCQGHKKEVAQTASMKAGEGCCCAGGGCCAGGSCDKDRKAAATKASFGQAADAGAAEGCCGGDCCKDCACCNGHKSAHHASAKATDVSQKAEGSSCCGSCCNTRAAGR